MRSSSACRRHWVAKWWSIYSNSTETFHQYSILEVQRSPFDVEKLVDYWWNMNRYSLRSNLVNETKDRTEFISMAKERESYWKDKGEPIRRWDCSSNSSVVDRQTDRSTSRPSEGWVNEFPNGQICSDHSRVRDSENVCASFGYFRCEEMFYAPTSTARQRCSDRVEWTILLVQWHWHWMEFQFHSRWRMSMKLKWTDWCFLLKNFHQRWPAVSPSTIILNESQRYSNTSLIAAYSNEHTFALVVQESDIPRDAKATSAHLFNDFVRQRCNRRCLHRYEYWWSVEWQILTGVQMYIQRRVDQSIGVRDFFSNDFGLEHREWSFEYHYVILTAFLW